MSASWGSGGWGTGPWSAGSAVAGAVTETARGSATKTAKPTLRAVAQTSVAQAVTPSAVGRASLLAAVVGQARPADAPSSLLHSFRIVVAAAAAAAAASTRLAAYGSWGNGGWGGGSWGASYVAHYGAVSEAATGAVVVVHSAVLRTTTANTALATASGQHTGGIRSATTNVAQAYTAGVVARWAPQGSWGNGGWGSGSWGTQYVAHYGAVSEAAAGTGVGARSVVLRGATANSITVADTFAATGAQNVVVAGTAQASEVTAILFTPYGSWGSLGWGVGPWGANYSVWYGAISETVAGAASKASGGVISTHVFVEAGADDTGSSWGSWGWGDGAFGGSAAPSAGGSQAGYVFDTALAQDAAQVQTVGDGSWGNGGWGTGPWGAMYSLWYGAVSEGAFGQATKVSVSSALRAVVDAALVDDLDRARGWGGAAWGEASWGSTTASRAPWAQLAAVVVMGEMCVASDSSMLGAYNAVQLDDGLTAEDDPQRLAEFFGTVLELALARASAPEVGLNALWSAVDDAQYEPWAPVVDAQTGPWAPVVDAQTGSWQNTSNSPTGNWVDVDDDQTTNWT